MTISYPSPTFKQDFLAQWRSLNPIYANSDAGLGQTFRNAFRESFAAYFAPLWMVGWLLKIAAKRIGQGA